LIRTSYPVPPIAQIRLRWELAMRRTRRALEERRREGTAAATDSLQTASATRGHYLRLRWREDLRRERASFDNFFDQYDTLVGLLCVAAQEGVVPGMEEEFVDLRGWFISHYPKVKEYVAPHLDADPSDTLGVRWGRRSCDAFEAMFAPPGLEEVLANDGGNLIGRLIRTQAALTAWEASLTHRECTVGADDPAR